MLRRINKLQTDKTAAAAGGSAGAQGSDTQDMAEPYAWFKNTIASVTPDQYMHASPKGGIGGGGSLGNTLANCGADAADDDDEVWEPCR